MLSLDSMHKCWLATKANHNLWTSATICLGHHMNHIEDIRMLCREGGKFSSLCVRLCDDCQQMCVLRACDCFVDCSFCSQRD